MNKLTNKLLNNEIITYLFFGGLTMVLSISLRELFFNILHNASLASVFSNIIAILFAFVLNDRFVFKQAREGRLKRLFKFSLFRLVTLILEIVLAYLFVDQFPQVIGQFVNNDIKMVNRIETLIGQVLTVILNYILSKAFVFRGQKKK